MRIILTDSGLGGLSICANVVNKITKSYTNNEIEIVYVNAVPKTQDGFNVMGPISEQIKVFDNFLHNISKMFVADAVYVVCNSLSAILPKTSFSKNRKNNISGIIDIGIASIINSFKKQTNSKIVILGAETTIKENIYFKGLVNFSIPKDKIISQSCPELANTISNDPDGSKVYQLIDSYLNEALKSVNTDDETVLLYLGCTHYGYRTELFKRYLDKYEISYKIINPNIIYSNTIISDMQVAKRDGTRAKPQVRFITHYPIPKNEVNTITRYLNDISSETVNAIQNFIVEDDLY